MKKLLIFIFSMITALFLALPFVSAHCPLCTAAVGTGVAVTRFYGVDDSIVGLWIGAFVISIALWFDKELKKRNKKIKFQGPILAILSFVLTVVPFYIGGLITSFSMVRSMPEHHSMLGLGVLGIDKLLIGIIVGSVLSYLWMNFGSKIRNKKRKLYVPFQTIILTVVTLIVFSLIFYFIV